MFNEKQIILEAIILGLLVIMSICVLILLAIIL